MTWKISESHIKFFRKDLWKDERAFFKENPLYKDCFSKHCFTEELAQLEFNILELLSAFDCSPKPIAVVGEMLYMEWTKGVRLFDLIRLLRQACLKPETNIQAKKALEIVFSRLKNDLYITQNILLDNNFDFNFSSYPVNIKIESLLNLFIEIFSIDIGGNYREQNKKFGEYWCEKCSLIPFRDATTKNYIFADKKLDLSICKTENSRYQTLNSLLVDFDQDYWKSIPILGIDYSSIENLTTPEDDVISLYFHEWTYGTVPLLAENLLLINDRFEVDNYRAAATFLVRFLRFGGRKLAYKLINSQGFEVRFKYDNPNFYFLHLHQICKALNSDFVIDFSEIFDVINKISFELNNISHADDALLKIDYFRQYYGESGKYWQENPSEQYIT